MDFIFIVCDSIIAQPAWPGEPMVAQWGVPDPATDQGTVAERALRFADAFRMLNNRISVFANLRLDALDQLALRSRLQEIGQAPATAEA